MSGIVKKPIWPFRPNVRSLQYKSLYAWWPTSQPKTDTVYELQRGLHGHIHSTSVDLLWDTSDVRGGYTLSFTGGTNEFAGVSPVPTLTFPITFSAWVKSNDSSTDAWIFSHDDGFTDSGWRIATRNGNLAFVLGGVADYEFTTLPLVSGKWYFVAVTVDANSGTATGYLNNVSESIAIGTMSGTPISYTIGFAANSLDNWNGGLDDIRLYNRALKPSEISQIYNPQTRFELYQSGFPDYEAVVMALSTVFEPAVSGGIKGGGTASVWKTYSNVASGGATLGSTAPVQTTILMVGGATLGGTAVLSTEIVASGGVLGAGLVVPNGITNEPPFGQAIRGVKCAGTVQPQQRRNINYTASGEVVMGGVAKGGEKNTRYNATGGVSVGNDQNPVGLNYKFNKIIEFLWNINYLIEKDITFLWSTGQLQIFWYRIIGKGIPGNVCDPLEADPCCQKFIMNVHARTLAELCEKLSKRRYKFPIESVQKFSRPAENSQVAADEESGINHDCNKLTPVEICGIPQCADFCVEYDVKVYGGFEMSVQVDSFLFFTSTGNTIFIGGAAETRFTKNLPNFPYVASGGLTLTGDAEFGPNHFNMRGGAIMSGTASVQSSRHSFVGGNWPEVTSVLFGHEVENLLEKPNDVSWQLPERVFTDNSQYTQSDISFGKSSQFLIVRDLRLGLPPWASIMGIKVRVDRKATQVGVRDEELYLLHGDDIISDNLADLNNDWPLIETTKVYGGSGLDSGRLWRDPNGEDYLGPFDPEELNESGFGIAIRVRARNSLPATIAKIDYISIEVFYENPEGSVLHIGRDVDVRCLGPNYHYASTGKIKLSSIPAFKKGMKFKSKGLGSDALPELQIGGRATLGFYENPVGGVELGSTTHVSPYNEEGTGGAVCTGVADVKPYIEDGTGGAGVGGKAKAQHSYRYTADGGLTLTGDFFSPEVQFKYTATGGLTLGSTTRVRCSSFRFVSDGNAVFILGSADQKASDIGDQFTQMEFSMEVLQTTATFLSDVDKQDAEALTGSVNKCGCLSIPLTVNLTHNIARDNLLAQFLVRNNYTIGKSLQMKYNVPNDSWQANLHYRGLSSDTNNRESWDLIFELQCTDVMGGIGIGRSIWKLAIQIFRKNLTTHEDFETRILVGVLPEGICGLQGNQLDFEVSYDTQLGFALVDPNAVVYQNTIFDNIGLFKNRAWIDDSALLLKLSQSSDTPTRRVDVTDAVFV